MTDILNRWLRLSGTFLITRRKFLISVVTAWLCLPGLYKGVSADTSQRRNSKKDKQLRQLVEKLFKDTESARAVGLGYLATHPDTAADVINRVRDFIIPARNDQECLTRQRRDDFTRGQTVTVDGWILARCEVDLCAALALLTHKQ